MGGKGKNKNTKKRRKQPATTATKHSQQQEQQQEQAVLQRSNFYSGAGPGCYIARRDLTTTSSDTTTTTTSNNDWILEWEDVSPDDFEDPLSDIPELAIDPEQKTLSMCNTREATTIVAYISVLDTPVLGRNRQRLPQGTTTDNQGNTRSCVTFIVLCPPRVFCHLCYLDVNDQVDIFKEVVLESDVQEWNQHPQPQDEHPQPLAFPLHTATTTTTTTTPSYLCTQGEGGQLTHFFSGNLHAIDFRCPQGTPLVAVGNGTVVETKDHNTLTGIAVSNLFEWNTIMLQLDIDNDIDNDDKKKKRNGPLFVEYVHIQKSFVQQGDKVTKGQIIGQSGSVGFSPEPHLHFAAYRSKDPTAPTVRVRFQATTTTIANDDDDNDNEPILFLPKAGKYYNAQGETTGP